MLAGSSKDGSGKKVALMDLVHDTIVDLPDLKHPLKDVGMLYDVDTKMLTIAGKNSEGSATNADLTVLTYVIANPMLVSDKEYLYVLGGENSARCVRTFKKNPRDWKHLPDLPKGDELPAGASLAEEYNGHLYSGALVYDKKVRVLTRTQFLTLEDDPHDMDKKIWVVKTYQDTNKIIHLTPILHDDKIVAGIV